MASLQISKVGERRDEKESALQPFKNFYLFIVSSVAIFFQENILVLQ